MKELKVYRFQLKNNPKNNPIFTKVKAETLQKAKIGAKKKYHSNVLLSSGKLSKMWTRIYKRGN